MDGHAGEQPNADTTLAMNASPRTMFWGFSSEVPAPLWSIREYVGNVPAAAPAKKSAFVRRWIAVVMLSFVGRRSGVL